MINGNNYRQATVRCSARYLYFSFYFPSVFMFRREHIARLNGHIVLSKRTIPRFRDHSSLRNRDEMRRNAIFVHAEQRLFQFIERRRNDRNDRLGTEYDNETKEEAAMPRAPRVSSHWNASQRLYAIKRDSLDGACSVKQPSTNPFKYAVRKTARTQHTCTVRTRGPIDAFVCQASAQSNKSRSIVV